METIKKTPVIAYYLKEKNGGYEVYSVHIEEDTVLETKQLNDADAWDQSVGVLEQYLAKQFE